MILILRTVMVIVIAPVIVVFGMWINKNSFKYPRRILAHG